MKNKIEKIKDVILVVVVTIVTYIMGSILIYFTRCGNNKNKKPDIPTPVEKEVIDTLYITRDSIIYRTKYLETIKHDTIEKIYKLDDTSTIDLFYKLVSK